uniref:R3H domain-containing protein n=1 Tax=Aureoumbra lagunensis TaxID=44058 RepID=A0A7S3K6R0_9STRA|mmetsp:Transcript_22783/g.29509  ORF Transcript_22783/g.29509 Transcript_22783/m.29509 type:complete len:462 (+) Transcript_22783:53-1438(+)
MPAGGKSWWWKNLDETIVDPITLEPIRDLVIEPFRLENSFYFDGEALALYMVASGVFENPLNRQPLSIQQCKALDHHLERNGLRRLDVSIEHASRLNSSQRNRQTQLTAEAILQSLFGGTRRRRREVTGGRSLRHGLEGAISSEQQSLPISSSSVPRFPRQYYQQQEQRTQESDFPALSEPKATIVNDWGSAIRRTRQADERRTRLRREDQHAAEAAATNARLVYTARIISRDAKGIQLKLCDELRATRGAFITVRERRDEALALWPDDLINFGRILSQQKRLTQIEHILAEIVHDPARYASRDFPAQPKSQDRKASHAIAQFYGLESISLEFGPNRHLRVSKTNNAAAIPHILLSDAIVRIDTFSQFHRRTRRNPSSLNQLRRQRGTPFTAPEDSSNLVLQPPSYTSTTFHDRTLPHHSRSSTITSKINVDTPPTSTNTDDDPLLQEAIRRSLADVWTTV